MPLDEATGIVHWKKPVVFDNHQVDTSQEVRETHLKDAVDDQKSERVALMVTRVTGRSAAEGEALAVLYVLNVPDTVSETNNVAQGSGTACPECLHVLMAIGLKGGSRMLSQSGTCARTRCCRSRPSQRMARLGTGTQAKTN